VSTAHETELIEDGASSHPVSLWHNRDYILLWSGQAVSTAGTQVAQIAFPLLILAMTGSPAHAGLMSALRIMPYIVLSLPAGALVARWDRKWAMIVCDTGRAIALGSIPLTYWTGHLSLAQLYLVALAEGTLAVFFGLANTSALPQVVGKEQLSRAMAQNEAAWQGASLLGPLLGGGLYTLGRAVPFLVDAVSFAASVVSLRFIRREFQEARAEPPGQLRQEILEGVRWLWGQPLIRTMAVLGALYWVAFSGETLVVIVLAKGQHASPGTIGIIFSVGGVGGLIGSLLASRASRLGFGRVVITAAWLMAGLWSLYALGGNLVVLAVIHAGIWLVFPIYNVVQMGYRLALTPDQLQGRVNSVFRLIAFTGQPVGMALSGVLLESVGARGTVVALLVSPVLMATLATMSVSVREAVPLAEVQAA
jgi:MFS family permease